MMLPLRWKSSRTLRFAGRAHTRPASGATRARAATRAAVKVMERACKGSVRPGPHRLNTATSYGCSLHHSGHRTLRGVRVAFMTVR
jgi:hypothetical protein